MSNSIMIFDKLHNYSRVDSTKILVAYSVSNTISIKFSSFPQRPYLFFSCAFNQYCLPNPCFYCLITLLLNQFQFQFPKSLSPFIAFGYDILLLRSLKFYCRHVPLQKRYNKGMESFQPNNITNKNPYFLILPSLQGHNLFMVTMLTN